MLEILDVTTDYGQTMSVIGTPRFSWKVRTGGAGQTAYRLIVSSSEENARKGAGDLFDSGKVLSSQSVNVLYGGRQLPPRTSAFWRVTVYSEENSATSDVQTFETAPAPSDFLGTWMAMPVNNQGGTALFRKRVSLRNDKIVRARAYVCGLGYHELFINGCKAGKAVLAPAVSDYSQSMYYCTYDIAPLLRAGDNVLGIEVGHGWLGSKKVLAQFYIDYENGETDEFHSYTNSGWWVGGSPTVDNSVYGGETYDARKEDYIPKNWATVDFEPQWNTGWMFTIFSPAPQGTLLPQPMEDIEVCDAYPAVSVKKLQEGVFVYDVGANIAGWARIRVRGERGSSVTLKFGERLCDDGSVNRINLRTAAATDVYILRGEGEEEFAPRFTYHGFQYVQAETSGKVEILSLVGEHVHNALRKAGTFACSDEQLARLHEIAVRTECNNEHSVLTDCPQRDERFGWLNDWGSRFYQTVYNRGMERFFPKTMRDVTETQTEEGGIGDTAPFNTGGRPADPVSVAYLLMPVWCYTYYGDARPACEEYEHLRKWVDCLLARADNYIMTYTYYGDWVFPDCYKDERADGLCISTFYLYWHLQLMVKLAQITGHADDETVYSKHAEKCCDRINEVYFHENEKSYSNGSQAENAIALTLNLVPERYRADVADHLLRSVKEHNYHSTCGNVGYRHLFYVLGDFHHAEEAIAILKNPEYPGWGFMLANGATSVWERWEREMDVEMDSFDHPMFGSYDAFFYRYLGGIGVCDDACGCDKMIVAPQCPESLTFVNCSFDTVRGKVVSNWERKNGKIYHHIEIPAGVTATVTVGGKTQACTEGVYEFQG